MPQLGHLLVRPGVLNISSILNYFDIISYISHIVPTAPILQIQVFFQGGCKNHIKSYKQSYKYHNKKKKHHIKHIPIPIKCVHIKGFSKESVYGYGYVF